MDVSENATPQEWLDSLKYGEIEPNLISDATDTTYSGAWVREHEGEYYVWYEDGVTRVDRKDPTRIFLGNIAVRDIDGLNPEEANERLLDSARASAPDRESAATQLSLLMGLKPFNIDRLKPRPHEKISFEFRFIAQMSKLTKLSRERVEGLGLQHFRSLPFRSKADRCVYVVSREDLNNEWPALRYSLAEPKWDYRLLAQHEALSLEGFQDKEYKASLLRGSGWIAIREEEIVQLCNLLAQKQPVDSL